MAEEVVLPRFVTQAPHPLRALLVGNSGSGKSTFISQLIGNKDQVFPRPGYVKFVYCSPNQPQLDILSQPNQPQLNILSQPKQAQNPVGSLNAKF